MSNLDGARETIHEYVFFYGIQLMHLLFYSIASHDVLLLLDFPLVAEPPRLGSLPTSVRE
jgi:hypothetical protein